LTERPATDVNLTRDLIVTTASRYGVLPGLSYLDFIKQLLPMWLLTQEKLTPSQRDLVANGISFSKHILGAEVRLQMPKRDLFLGESPHVMQEVKSLLREVVRLRDEEDPAWEDFQGAVRMIIDSMGSHKGQALHRLRIMVGQEQGMPAARFLYVLPIDYLQVLEYMCDLYVQAHLPHSPAPQDLAVPAMVPGFSV
jgi:hypothetical protein